MAHSLIYLFGGRYSATILLLCHFDVFQNLASHESSPRDQIGLSSKVASIIRKFTKPFANDEDGYAEDKSNGDFVRPNFLAYIFQLIRFSGVL